MSCRPVQKCGNLGGWVRSSVLSWFLICASLAMAQLDTGTISGTVSDQSGGAIPGARITIRNVATGVSRTAESNELGRYNAPALPAGNYEISAAVAGFQTLVRSGINLTVGRNAVVDLAMQVGEVAQSITITGEASRVDTTTATVSNLVDEKRVLDIPLNNRDLTNLAYLQPGVLRVPVVESYALGNAVAGGLGAKMSIGGARGSENTFLLDGVSNADHSGNPQTSTGALSGAETVQEFQVITNNFSAEYPSKPGGVISAVTKSGTNSFHGSLYEFLRNDNLDAAKWEDHSLDLRKPEFKRNNFGGSIGGPIIRDKTFFFGSYEGLREGRSRSTNITLPTAAGRAGNLGPNGPINSTTRTTIWPVDPAVRPYLALWPLPGGEYPLVRDLGDGRALAGASERVATTDDFGTLKLDHHFVSTRKGFLAVTWTGSDGDRAILPLFPSQPKNFYPTKKHVISVRHTSILSPPLLNEFTFGHNRTEATEGFDIRHFDFTNVNGVNLNYIPGHKSIGFIGTNDELSSVGNDYGDFGGEIFRQRIFTFKDSLSLTRTNHTMKIGAEINRTAYPYHKNPRINGPFSFDSFANFLIADPSDFRIGNPPGVQMLGYPIQNIQDFDLRTITAGFYFQDNWKLRPSLTLNLGLRYEFQTVPTENEGNWYHLVNLTSNQVVRDAPFTNPTFRNFGPRIGFAWAPGSQTSIRGGFGVFYSLYTLLNMAHSTGEMAPINTNVRIRDAEAMAAGAGGIRFPDVFTTQFDVFQRAASPDMRWIETNQKPSYIYRFSLTIDREIGPWFLNAGYSGSLGRHLWVNNEAGISQWIGYPNNVPTDQKQFPARGVRINPAFNNISIQSPRGNSYYHGMTASVSRRLNRGLQLQAAYTLSKNIDQGSGTANVTDNYPQGQRIIYHFDIDHRTGRAPYDIRNNLVSNVTFDFPRLPLTGVGGALLNGWQVNGIVSLSDGHAFYVTDAANADQRRAFTTIGGLRPNLVPNGNNDPVLGTPERYYDETQFIPSTCRGGVYCYTEERDSSGRLIRVVGQPSLGYAVGYFGNLGNYTLTGPGLVTFDFSLNKDFQLTEAKRIQFRSEFFNLFNRANFGLPNSGVFLSDGRRNPEAGLITSTRTSARQIQFGLKFIF